MPTKKRHIFIGLRFIICLYDKRMPCGGGGGTRQKFMQASPCTNSLYTSNTVHKNGGFPFKYTYIVA